MTHGKNEFLKYSVLQGKPVKELGFLKKCLIGGINSRTHFGILFERT